jgi:hypothetical protein
MRSIVDQNSRDVKSAFDKILSAPRKSEGERHSDIRHRTAQLVANGMSAESAAAQMRRLYPEKPPGDILRAAQGAVKLDYQPWATSPNGRHEPTFKPYQHDGSEEPLPTAEIAMPYSQFFKEVLGFRDDEFIWFGTKETKDGGRDDGETYFSPWKEGVQVGRLITKSGTDLDQFSGRGFNSIGSFFVVNPLLTGENRKTANVSRFKYALFESDKISREEQLATYHNSGLPIACITDTGGKSVHAVVRMDAVDLKQFNERAAIAKQILGPNFDATQDPVRFSRLPNSRNGEYESRQRLIELSSGPATWQEFEEALFGDGINSRG